MCGLFGIVNDDVSVDWLVFCYVFVLWDEMCVMEECVMVILCE